MAEYIERAEVERVLMDKYNRFSGLRPDFYAGFAAAYEVIEQETKSYEFAPEAVRKWGWGDMPKKTVEQRTCGECIHEFACQLWHRGTLHDTDASGCGIYTTVKDSAAYLIGKMDGEKGVAQVKWERDMAMKQLENYGVGFCENAEVKKVVRAEWVTRPNGVVDLSNCGCLAMYDSDFKVYVLYPYCPNCGAKMEGKHERSDD